MSDTHNDKSKPNVCPKCGIESHSGIQYCMTCGLDFKTAENLARKIKSRERPLTLIETVVGLLMLVALIGGGVSTLHDWIKERSARRESVHASYSSSKIEGHYAWNGGLQEDYKFPQIMTLEFRKDGTFTQTTIVGGECPGKDSTIQMILLEVRGSGC
jgi:hypothetical protein